VRQLFADTGLVSSDATFADGRQGWEIKMLVGGDAAQSVLELARQRGFESARILPPSLN
jgi:hypothetical protein